MLAEFLIGTVIGTLMGLVIGWLLCQGVYVKRLAESTVKLKEAHEALGQSIGIEQALTARLNEVNAHMNQPKNNTKPFAA